MVVIGNSIDIHASSENFVNVYAIMIENGVYIFIFIVEIHRLRYGKHIYCIENKLFELEAMGFTYEKTLF